MSDNQKMPVILPSDLIKKVVTVSSQGHYYSCEFLTPVTVTDFFEPKKSLLARLKELVRKILG